MQSKPMKHSTSLLKKRESNVQSFKRDGNQVGKRRLFHICLLLNQLFDSSSLTIALLIHNFDVLPHLL